MTKDYTILENFQLLIPRGKQQVYLSSARESAWREVVSISPVAAGTRACKERFGTDDVGVAREGSTYFPLDNSFQKLPWSCRKGI